MKWFYKIQDSSSRGIYDLNGDNMELMYRVTELNVTLIWIRWAGWLAMECMAKFSPSGLRFIPSLGSLEHHEDGKHTMNHE